jgi:uncharacterized protein (TIGR03067 family)
MAASTGADAQPKGLDQLKGSWKVVKAQPARPDGPPRFEPKRLVINGDKVTLYFDEKGKQKRATRIKVDPKAKPAHIDIQRGEKKDDVFRGIYELKGDTLRICFSEGLYSIRPTEFKAVDDPERPVNLVILKREKKQEGK